MFLLFQFFPPSRAKWGAKTAKEQEDEISHQINQIYLFNNIAQKAKKSRSEHVEEIMKKWIKRAEMMKILITLKYVSFAIHVRTKRGEWFLTHWLCFYPFWRLKSIYTAKCVQSDIQQANNEKRNYIDIKNWFFYHSSFVRRCCCCKRIHQHGTKSSNRESENDGEKRRKIYVRNKCVNMSDTTFLLFALFYFISRGTCCNFLVDVESAVITFSVFRFFVLTMIKLKGKWKHTNTHANIYKEIIELDSFKCFSRF